MSVVRQNLSECIGCGTCAKVCPMDVFRLDTVHGKSVIAYVQNCQTCGQCWLNCPTNSIGLQDAEISFGMNNGR